MKDIICNVWLKQALTIGIDYKLFWELNPRRMKPFIEAFKAQQENKRDEINLAAWLNGFYVSKAIAANFSKNKKYLKKPIDLSTHQGEGNPDVAKFSAWAKRFNQNMNKGGKKDGHR